jgi:hypothetical protein
MPSSSLVEYFDGICVTGSFAGSLRSGRAISDRFLLWGTGKDR